MPFSLVQLIQKAASQNAARYLYHQIPKASTDVDYNDTPMQANQSYLRVWLTEMYLTKSRTWYTTWFPAVHVSASLKFGDQNGQSFSRVIQPPNEATAHGVLLNYAIVDLMPFNGGTVEVEASLLAMQGQNYLNDAIGVLQDFSSLVAPPFAAALTIAEKVSNGLEKLLNATDGVIHLPFHQTYVEGGGGGNALRAGYIAIILATAQQVDAGRLQIRQDRLYYQPARGGAAEPFRNYDYMLLRVEGREQREDYMQLASIKEPYQGFFDALAEGNTEKATAFKQMALIAAARSSDLTVADRRRVAMALKEEFQTFEKLGMGAQGVEEPTIDRACATYGMPMAQAAALGEVDLDEILI